MGWAARKTKNAGVALIINVGSWVIDRTAIETQFEIQNITKVLLEVHPEDEWQHDDGFHPVAVGHLAGDLVNWIVEKGVKKISIGFDIPMNEPEIWEMVECRQWAYGFLCNISNENFKNLIGNDQSQGALNKGVIKAMANIALRNDLNIKPKPPMLPAQHIVDTNTVLAFFNCKYVFSEKLGKYIEV